MHRSGAYIQLPYWCKVVTWKEGKKYIYYIMSFAFCNEQSLFCIKYVTNLICRYGDHYAIAHITYFENKRFRMHSMYLEYRFIESWLYLQKTHICIFVQPKEILEFRTWTTNSMLLFFDALNRAYLRKLYITEIN